MACRKRIKFKADLVCIGDMKRQVTIYSRSISSVNSGVDFGESFTNATNYSAMIKTTSGKTIFDNTGIERDVTHEFYIRYDSSITQENWLEYDSKYYDILTVEDLNEQHRFLKLSCTERGSIGNAVNQTNF